MRLLYLANARIPTEKAHGLQIMQNCEALADEGTEVRLWAARRLNTAAMRSVSDPWAYYGIRQNFSLWRVPCLDLQPWASQKITLLRKGAFLLQYASYLLVLGLALLFTRADIYYSRDLPSVLLLSFVKPQRKIAYETAPSLAFTSRAGIAALALHHAGRIFPITPTMAED